MRQYYSNNKNYNAILESMAQIRQNQLNEMHGGMHSDEEEMEEGMHGDEEEMEERYMYEGEHEDDEDAQMEALAEMMDEALMELDDEDDNDNQMLDEDEDDDRRARRRARLRNALLIGAGLVATGGVAGAAMMNPTARGMITKGATDALSGAGELAKGVGTAAYGMLPQNTRDSISGGIESAGAAASGAIDSLSSAYKQGEQDALRAAEKLYHGGKTRYNLATKGRQNMYDNPYG